MILWEFYIRDEVKLLDDFIKNPHIKDMLFVGVVPVDDSLSSRFTNNIISLEKDIDSMTLKCQAYIPKLEKSFCEKMIEFYDIKSEKIPNIYTTINIENVFNISTFTAFIFGIDSVFKQINKTNFYNYFSETISW